MGVGRSIAREGGLTAGQFIGLPAQPYWPLGIIAGRPGSQKMVARNLQSQPPFILRADRARCTGVKSGRPDRPPRFGTKQNGNLIGRAIVERCRSASFTQLQGLSLTGWQTFSGKRYSHQEKGHPPVSAQRVQLLRKPGYQRGVVACRKCGAPIPVQNFSALPDEFSVRCPSCGERAFYAKRAVAIQDLPERRKKPRR